MRRIFFLFLLMCSFSYGLTLNINTATSAQLQLLNGIGPTKADAIIRYRNQHGPFKTLSALENVDGIGPKTVEKIRAQLTTGNTPPRPTGK